MLPKDVRELRRAVEAAVIGNIDQAAGYLSAEARRAQFCGEADRRAAKHRTFPEGSVT